MGVVPLGAGVDLSLDNLTCHATILAQFTPSVKKKGVDIHPTA